MFTIAPSARLRPSPFFDSTLEEGVASFTAYNNMLMPTGYGDPEAEYWRLINDVSLWDVSVQRQVEMVGPDAARLAQTLCPRDLSSCAVGQGKYVALCNHDGTIINDPVALKLDENRFWFSLADSNILFWARAIAKERKMDVNVFEPDVSPLAIQGPKAEDLAAALLGDWVRELKYFWFREAKIGSIPIVAARSGWSKQGGFEFYLTDSARGNELWRIVREAGKPFGIGPGNPNPVERIESGLLSWGGDTDDQTNPFEVRMEPYIDLDVPDDVIGIDALRRIKSEGAKRHLLGIVLEGKEPAQPAFKWFAVSKAGAPIGHMTNIIWSYRLEKNIGFALVERSAQVTESVEVALETRSAPKTRSAPMTQSAPTQGTLTHLPFL